ncbi:MAG: TenA family protein [Pseudomonadota bacterium]
MSAKTLWNDNLATARACLEHPFVQGIATGALRQETFKLYVAQDAFFLEAFARAYAMGIAKAPDRDGLNIFRDLLNGVFEELNLHQEYAARWGITLDTAPIPSTRAYTDFLLATAALGPINQLAAAMTPCMRLYAWLGQSLVPDVNSDSPYREWVDTYAGNEIDSLAGELESLLDRYGSDDRGVADCYRTAMELELGFFEGAYTATP